MKALEPISIAGVQIPNRVVRTAHGTHFGDGGIVPSLIDYHVERARGGVGPGPAPASWPSPPDTRRDRSVEARRVALGHRRVRTRSPRARGVARKYRTVAYVRGGTGTFHRRSMAVARV